MRARDGLAGLLVLLLVVAIGAPALAAPPESERPLDEAFRFSWAGQIISEGGRGASSADPNKGWAALVEKELKAAKQKLIELKGVRKAALVLYSGPDEACERETTKRWYREERSRLNDNIRALRALRGDRRGFLTKAWHRIGPVGRRIVRAIGDEAVTVLKSGGTLHGGVARRILVRVGRKQLKNVVLASIARNIQARAAAARSAAEEACKKPSSSLRTTDPGVSPPATAEALTPAIGSGAWPTSSICAAAPEGVGPPPPYSKPYSLVHFDWASKADVMVTYFASSSEDPMVKYPSYDAVRTAGCIDEIYTRCQPLIPLVFTEAAWSPSPSSTSEPASQCHTRSRGPYPQVCPSGRTSRSPTPRPIVASWGPSSGIRLAELLRCRSR